MRQNYKGELDQGSRIDGSVAEKGEEGYVAEAILLLPLSTRVS